MKSTTFISAAVVASVLALASCSQQEDLPQPVGNDDGAIHFTARTDYTQGAGDITTNNLKSFNVYAYTDSAGTREVFMNNVTVSKTGSNTWTYSPIQYWPAKESVDFYAFAPASWVGTQSPLTPVSYSSYPGHDDIIYAVSPDLTGNTGQANAQVVFNFRHALAKVTVKLHSSDPKLQVKVSHMALANIYSKGNFNFPSASTSLTPSEESVGHWTDQNSAYAYPMLWSEVMADVVTLTTTPTVIPVGNMSFGSILYLIPQNLTWRSNGTGNDTYIGVNCAVFDAETGTKLWPNKNTPPENVIQGSTLGEGILKFPLSTSNFSAWKPGYHYIYSLEINANEDMGAIEFGEPVVETYVDVETNYE